MKPKQTPHTREEPIQLRNIRDEPPRWAQRLMERITAPHLREEIQGDLDELFHKRGQRSSYTKARWLYVVDILFLLHPRLWRRQADTPYKATYSNANANAYPSPSSLHPIMIRNYVKIALRNFAKHKVYSFINLGGLTLAVVACILIGLFVRQEYSYDRFNQKADRLYRAWTQELYQGETFINTVTPYILGPTLQSTYPEVEAMARVETRNVNVRKGTEVLNERVHLADPALFTLFDFPIEKGSQAPLQEFWD